MDLRNINLRNKAHSVQASSEAATIELSNEQLSSVSGGKGKASPTLMKACARGEHLSQAKITC
jgi:bacteriocin-like protein